MLCLRKSQTKGVAALTKYALPARQFLPKSARYNAQPSFGFLTLPYFDGSISY